ncbi:hypothetical protein G7046_g9493 [Stylonectria norvegica]|nr:hypothetical protein G7046_g9493 [Stylonectria norvegica]
MDDEFPMRNPGTGIATPTAAEMMEFKVDPIRPEHDAQPEAPPAPQSVASPRPDAIHINNSDSDTVPADSMPVATARIPPRRRPETSSAIRYSTISADTNETKGSKDRPHRKKSTIRGALGKLFGRKRKANGHGSVDNTSPRDGSPRRGSNQLRSVTENVSQTSDQKFTERQQPMVRSRPFPGAESKRSASLPITEFDRALRSHSVGPEDVLAIESARNSLSADFSLSKRRAVAIRSRDGDLAGLSPRPASTHGRDYKEIEKSDDPNQIGRAITSDFTRLRRRSRSLSGLIEAEDDHNKARRRSDEIRYWRESYDPAFMSPVSSAPEGEDAALLSTEPVARAEERPPNTPLEPFAFGSFATMNEMAGMKITQAAGLESRIDVLETRVQQLEHVLSQMCNTTADFTPRIDSEDYPAPPASSSEPSTTYRIRPAPRNTSTPHKDTHDMMGSFRPNSSRRSEASHMSFGEAPTFVGSVHRSAAQPAFVSTNRPTSTATIRAATSLPSLPKDTNGPLTLDHYATLMALIQTERSAREALEAQVKSLGHQVSILARSSHSVRATQFDPPPTAKSFGDLSAFDHDEDEEYGTAVATRPRSQLRTMDPEDSGIAAGYGDESVYSETFETPSEESHNFGAFGEDLEEEDQSQKKTARTLSLSQLTLTKKSSKISPQAM